MCFSVVSFKVLTFSKKNISTVQVPHSYVFAKSTHVVSFEENTHTVFNFGLLTSTSPSHPRAQSPSRNAIHVLPIYNTYPPLNPYQTILFPRGSFKMISGRSSVRFDQARRRLLACGYDVADCELKEIHCNQVVQAFASLSSPDSHLNLHASHRQQPGCEELEWIENGFIQGFVTVDGRSARVMDYAPGQLLQPHKHDLDELFEIRGGSVEVSVWPEGKDGKKETRFLKAGDLIEIPTGIPHSLCCDKENGLQVHCPYRACLHYALPMTTLALQRIHRSRELGFVYITPLLSDRVSSMS